MNREEVIRLPRNAELQAATLIFGINHWQAPLQRISPTVMSIFPIDLTNHRHTNTRWEWIVMTTSLSSKLSSCSPNSLLTSQLFPLSKGQQLIVKGIKDSSVVCSLHFSTPTSLFTGNDFSGFFKPMRDSAVKSFLSTFGCVWNEKRSLKFRVTSKGARQDGSVGKGSCF